VSLLLIGVKAKTNTNLTQP